jgi:hypothetical protein
MGFPVEDICCIIRSRAKREQFYLTGKGRMENILIGIPFHFLLSVWVLFAYAFCPALFLCFFIRAEPRRAFPVHSSFDGAVWGKLFSAYGMADAEN